MTSYVYRKHFLIFPYLLQNWLSIPDYSIMRADHPSNTQKDELFYTIKNTGHLDIIRRDNLLNLKQCLVTEVAVKDELYFSCAYDILINSINSLNRAISIIAGDFNGKCSKWCSFDTSDNIGMEVDIITSTKGYNQITDKPGHFPNHPSSCIDSITTSNPTIEKSLCNSSHYNIIYEKINFRAPLPQRNFRTVSDYKNANVILFNVLYKTLIGNMHLKKLLMRRYKFLVKYYLVIFFFTNH